MNTFGRLFRVSIFGESHGPMVGCTIDGVTPGVEIDAEAMMKDIARRKSGGLATTPRKEEDIPIIASGILDGKATGAPMTILFLNKNIKSQDYQDFSAMPRPGHADFTGSIKYCDSNDLRGGGHFSGRLTLPIVAAGFVAKACMAGFNANAELIEVGGVTPRVPAHAKNDPDVKQKLQEAIAEGDSLGGIVECTIKFSAPLVGLGEPFWDSLESVISHAIFAIPGVRGIEFGDGFAAARMKGSEHNDPMGENMLPTKNGSGGVNGGISNGAPIVFRVAFKPTASIAQPQKTYNFAKKELDTLKIKGRHDVCFALRTPVIVEAMAAICIMDLVAINDTLCLRDDDSVMDDMINEIIPE